MLAELGRGDHVAVHRDGSVACNIALPGEEFRLPNSPAHVEISVLRPDDLLNLEIVAVNLRLDTTDAENPVLVIDDRAQPALLVVGFPSQTIFEEAFFDSSPPPVPKPAPRTRIPDSIPEDTIESGLCAVPARRRLAARVQGAGGRTDPVHGRRAARLVHVRSLLSRRSRMYRAARRLRRTRACRSRSPRPPRRRCSCRFRLHLSPPTHHAVWQHDPNLVNHAGRVELWHTRLATRDANGEGQQLSADNQIGLRAIWSPDYQPGGPVPSPGTSGLSALPTIAPMDIADRHQIVVLTAAFDGYAVNSRRRFVPTPVKATMLMLSPLGGWLVAFGRGLGPADQDPATNPVRTGPGVDHILNGRVEAVVAPAAERAFAIEAQQAFLDPERIALNAYDLDPKGKLDLSQWTHIAAQGRDHYVRLVYEGRLKDLGHRASLVKVTERRFEESPNGVPVAYLRQYMYVVVKEPEKYYPNEGLADGGRGMPLRRVRLTTLVTPHIEYPYENKPYDGHPAVTDQSFWVMVNKQDFLFHGYAEDLAGNRIDFQKPLIFVPNSETDFASIDTAIKSERARISASITGQKVTFAERLPDGDPAAGKDNTSLVTEVIYFENEGPSGDAFFKPRIFAADVHLPAVEALTGSTAGTSIRLTADYLANGFGDAANKTGTFAEIVSHNAAVSGDLSRTALGSAFSAVQAGGFSTPSLDIVCLTRGAGPLGGKIADAMSNTFDPKQVFKAGLAMLFGAFDLADLLPGGGSVDDHAPKMQVERQGTNVITDLDWQSPISAKFSDKFPAAIVDFVPRGQPTALTVHAVITKDLAGGAGTFALDGALNDFSIVFLASRRSSSRRSRSPRGRAARRTQRPPRRRLADRVQRRPVVRGRPAQDHPAGCVRRWGEHRPDPEPARRQGRPEHRPAAATVGVFALKNIAFSAGLTIPFFDGKPVVEFGFASRDKPFLLAVMIFGGSGFAWPADRLDHARAARP